MNANVNTEIKTSSVWGTAIAELQGMFVKPVDMCAETAKQYDMGKPVTLLIGHTKPTAVDISTDTAPVVRATKSEAVRELIRAARATGADIAAVAAQAQVQLSMTKALAAVYVKNNWTCK